MTHWNFRPARDLELSLSQRWLSLRRENGLISTGFHWAWWALARCYLGVWHRLAISGRQHLPAEPPFVLVANHSSHLDALALAAPLPWRLRDRVFPIAAGDVFFQSPLKSACAAGLLNALPMWRKKCGSHAIDQLRRRLLDEPCAYILFPEGTRSRDGVTRAFKPGLGMLVAGTSVPVVPCHLDGCFAALSASQRFPRPRRVRLRIGPPRVFADTPNDREGWLGVAAEMEAQVRALGAGQEAPRVADAPFPA